MNAEGAETQSFFERSPQRILVQKTQRERHYDFLRLCNVLELRIPSIRFPDIRGGQKISNFRFFTCLFQSRRVEKVACDIFCQQQNLSAKGEKSKMCVFDAFLLPFVATKEEVKIAS